MNNRGLRGSRETRLFLVRHAHAARIGHAVAGVHPPEQFDALPGRAGARQRHVPHTAGEAAQRALEVRQSRVRQSVVVGVRDHGLAEVAETEGAGEVAALLRVQQPELDAETLDELRALGYVE